ncbi:MAG: RnfABCDGE type electron transport complex subunit D [Woeseiaceae bacterium]|nr:RnfABCDGE type electron transport complex subunit D [Woeseiaceae bacterium]
MTPPLLSDPRFFQVAVLAGLVTGGALLVDIGIRWQHAAIILLTAEAMQFAGSRVTGLRHFDPRSALITALSLTMLLRTDTAWLAAAAAAIAVGSKFVLRVRGKHLFNPANAGIVGTMWLADGAWISTGQWGSGVLVALLLACLGLIVLSRARRAETTLAFLAVFAGLLVGRALWLGDPLAIPLHHLQNGALLIFAFFMISDPKTTPDAPAGRWLYGALVAAVAFAIQFICYQPYGPVLALAGSAPLVPLIDRVLPGSRYRWHAPAPTPLPSRTTGAPSCDFS